MSLKNQRSVRVFQGITAKSVEMLLFQPDFNSDIDRKKWVKQYCELYKNAILFGCYPKLWYKQRNYNGHKFPKSLHKVHSLKYKYSRVMSTLKISLTHSITLCYTLIGPLLYERMYDIKNILLSSFILWIEDLPFSIIYGLDI